MRVNNSGIDLIKYYESCSLRAYPDPASLLATELAKPPNARSKNISKMSGCPWTIGWGSTGINRFCSPPSPIGPNTVWTQEQADLRFLEDVAEFAKDVGALIKVNVTANQFSAIVSFTYNVGIGNLKGSTLLQLVNRGKFTQAADEFPKWNKAKGKVMNGLTKRREAERRLFLTA